MRGESIDCVQERIEQRMERNLMQRSKTFPGLFRLPSTSLVGAAFVCVLAVVAMLPAVPVLYHMPNTDASIFLLIGDKIRLGDLPYLDWYDHKPPLIFYLNALGLWLGGGSRWGVWGIELISISAASLFGYAFLRRFFGVLTSVVSVGLFLLNLVFIHQRGNMTEEYALPFQFAVIFLLSRVNGARRSKGVLFAIGCMLAMASSLKQPMAGIGVAAVVYLFLQAAYEDRWQDLALSFGFIGLGFAAVWAAWFLYFAVAGIFPEFWEAAFSYNVALSGITLQKRLGALVSAMDLLYSWSLFFMGGMVAWLAALPMLLINDDRIRVAFTRRWVGFLAAGAGGLLLMAALVFQPAVRALLVGLGFAALLLGGLIVVGRLPGWLRPAQPPRTWSLFLPVVVGLVDLPVAVVFSSLSGNNFAHYFMALLPSLTILTAFLIDSISSLFRPAFGRTITRAWIGILLLPMLIPGLDATLTDIGPRGDRQIEAVVRYVEENTSPNDTVLQWGIVPQVNLLTGRDAPSRYFFPDPLFVDGYSGHAQTNELLRDLQARLPVLIVYQGIARLPLLMPEKGQSCDVVKDPQTYADFQDYWRERVEYSLPQMPEGMGDVYYWICQNYESAGLVGELGWQVYRLKGK